MSLPFVIRPTSVQDDNDDQCDRKYDGEYNDRDDECRKRLR